MTALILRRPIATLRFSKPYIAGFERLAREIVDSGRLFEELPRLAVLNIGEEGDDLVVKTELPGIKKKELDITIKDKILTIEAAHKERKGKEETTRECFSGSARLPYHVDADKVSATFKKGLLEIRIPKPEEAKARRIEVKALKSLPTTKVSRRTAKKGK